VGPLPERHFHHQHRHRDHQVDYVGHVGRPRQVHQAEEVEHEARQRRHEQQHQEHPVGGVGMLVDGLLLLQPATDGQDGHAQEHEGAVVAEDARPVELGPVHLEPGQEQHHQQEHGAVACHQEEVLEPAPAGVVIALQPPPLGEPVDHDLVQPGEPEGERNAHPLLAPDHEVDHPEGIGPQEQAQPDGQHPVPVVDPGGVGEDGHTDVFGGLGGEFAETERHAEQAGHREERQDHQGAGGQQPDLPHLAEVELVGQPGPVILGREPAPGGHHQFAGFRLARAGVGAAAAVVTQPRLRRLDQLVPQAELQQADDLPREDRIPLGQAAYRGAVAAIEALVDGVAAVLGEFTGQVGVHPVSHLTPPSAGRRSSRLGLPAPPPCRSGAGPSSATSPLRTEGHRRPQVPAPSGAFRGAPR
jgi:hypothetical protein